jgi:hypothetical protein
MVQGHCHWQLERVKGSEGPVVEVPSPLSRGILAWQVTDQKHVSPAAPCRTSYNLSNNVA